MKELYRKIGESEKLTPCPFCGSPAELWEYEPTDGVIQKAAMCTNDGDENDDDAPDSCPMYMPPQGFYKATKREAIAEWNKRPQT